VPADCSAWCEWVIMLNYDICKHIKVVILAFCIMSN